MPREVQLRLSRPGRAVPVVQPTAASGGSNQETGTPGARRRGEVPQPEPEPEPEPESQTRGPPRAELRPRPSSARPRPTSAAGAAAGNDAAAQVVAGLHAARPSSAGGQGGQSRQRVRQQQQAAARLSNPLVPAVSRGQRRPNSAARDVVESPPPGGDIGLGLRGRRPASAGPARQRPSSAGPRYRAQAQPFSRQQDGGNGHGGGGGGGGSANYNGVSVGQVSNSAGTPRRAASSSGNDAGGGRSSTDGISAARGGVTPSQASSQQPQQSAAAEMMARRGISPGGVQQRAQPLQRPSSAPVRRSGSRDEAQRAADARRSAAVKSPGARVSLQEPSHRAGWVSARVNVSAAADGNERNQQPQPAVSPGELLPVPGCLLARTADNGQRTCPLFSPRYAEPYSCSCELTVYVRATPRSHAAASRVIAQRCCRPRDARCLANISSNPSTKWLPASFFSRRDTLSTPATCNGT